MRKEEGQDQKQFFANFHEIKCCPREKIISDKTHLYNYFFKDHSCLNIDQQSLLQNGILYHPQNFVKNLAFEVIAQTINSEATAINVTWGYFTTRLVLIKIQKESLMHHNRQMCGGFAQVYLEEGSDSSEAIKCIRFSRFKSKKKAKILAIRQYFLAKIASALGIGPLLTIYLGFDLIIYEDCIQFSMEKCIDSCSNYQNLIKDAKQNLLLLHKYHIIHFDIKPSNILYSNTYERYVFIDFGLSSIVGENLGQKSCVKFKGTINYCSPQMLDALNSQEKWWVDPYYNDSYSLNISIQQIELSARAISNKSFLNEEYLNENPIILSQLQKKKFILMIRMKYYLLVENMHKIESLYNENEEFIKKELIIDLLNYFKVLEPTENIISFYNKIKSQQKYRIDLRETNEVMETGLFRSSLTFMKRYFFNYQRKLSLNEQSLRQDLDLLEQQIDENSKFAIKNTIIQLLTSQDSIIKDKESIVSLTNNIYDALLEECINIANYCMKNILKIPSEMVDSIRGPLQIINSCIVYILEQYSANQSKNRLAIDEIKKMKINVFNLIEHVFILGKSEASKIIPIMQRIYKAYFQSKQQKFQFIFKIRSFLQWTIQKYEYSFGFDQQLYINHMEVWLYDIFNQLSKTKQERYGDVLKLLSLYLPLTGNKDYNSILQEVKVENILIFSRQFNRQLAIYHQLMVMEVNLYLVEYYAHFIFRITEFKQKFKLIPWTIKIYQFYSIAHNLQMSSKMYAIIKSNFKFPSILSQFFIFDGNKLLEVNSRKQFSKLFLQISQKISSALILKSPLYFQFLLYKYIKSYDNPYHNDNQSVALNQQIILSLDKLNGCWPAIGRQYLSLDPHNCIYLKYLSTIMNLKEAYYYLKSTFYHSILKELSYLKNLQVETKCQKCKWILQIFSLQFVNQHSIKKFSHNLALIQSQFIHRYQKINALIRDKCYQSLKNNFKVNNYLGLAYLCIAERSFQMKYQGVKKLYLHFKMEQRLQRYLSQTLLSEILFVTMDVVYTISLEEFVYFINKLAIYITNNYTKHFFGFLSFAVRRL